MSVLDVTTAELAMSVPGRRVSEPDHSSVPVDGREEISELSETACMILISASTVGRVAFVGAAGPELMSVNFVFADGVIYFLADPRGFLARLKRGQHAVAFGVDYHADSSTNGWDVTVTGTASRAGDRAARRMLLKLRRCESDERPTVMQIHIDSVAGRHVTDG